VSLVYSGQFVDSSTWSPASPSVSTRNARTPPVNAHTTRYAAPSA
jgi:hypothetical protein